MKYTRSFALYVMSQHALRFDSCECMSMDTEHTEKQHNLCRVPHPIVASVVFHFCFRFFCSFFISLPRDALLFVSIFVSCIFLGCHFQTVYLYSFDFFHTASHVENITESACAILMLLLCATTTVIKVWCRFRGFVRAAGPGRAVGLHMRVNNDWLADRNLFPHDPMCHQRTVWTRRHACSHHECAMVLLQITMMGVIDVSRSGV